MALFVPILGQLSGKIGDNVFSHNRGGNYCRAKGQNIHTPSARQAQCRVNLSNASSAWRALSSVQRAAWNLWATTNLVINRVGASIQLSGIAAFNTMSARAIDSGNTPPVTPPLTTPPLGLLTCTGALAAATAIATLTYTATPLPAGSKLAIYSTGPLLASQDPGEASAKLVAYSAAAAASPQTAPLPFATPAGTSVNIWVSVVDSSGRRSPAVKVRVIAA